jgi:hypothetical protein
LRVGKLCGNDPDLWLNLQKRYDLQRAEREFGAKIKAIPTLKVASDSEPGSLRVPNDLLISRQSRQSDARTLGLRPLQLGGSERSPSVQL